ncbi:MAG: small soluble extracytoplasmic protein [Rhodobacteraceae bacterium HLUCCA12]|nr:MAG: small soluble extracytoplasmic protein [Rhodobacteraceae bacterium HLUCCA12]
MAVLRRLAPIAFAIATTAAASAAFAQEGADGVQIELNRADQRDDACQLVFVARNDGAAGLDQLALEMVLFDRDGGVAKLTLLDFQALPAGRTRVRSFDMQGLDCASLGRVLVNATATCEPQDAPGCTDMTLESRLDEIEVLQ